MLKNRPLLLFLTMIAMCASWFSLKTIYEIYKFSVLDRHEKPVSEVNWTVKERGNDRYILKANYQYLVEGKTFFGETDLSYPVLKTKEAAESSIKKISSNKKTVWYSSSSPEISSIEKEFPTKGAIYAAILWGLFIYFLWLGFYAERLNSLEKRNR